MSFELVHEPISPAPLNHEGAGGFVIFEGKVRNNAGDREVLRLEYEAFPEMAIKEGETLVREAIERFELIAAKVVHRLGVLEIGEAAVWIQTAAAHRREAFAACEWIIDQLKVRVPIWKREFYEGGDSGWVGSGEVVPDVPSDFFIRQMRLPEVGANGQDKLGRARVLLVGVGGLASGSLPCLVGAGVGAIGLVDGDDVEISNLHRQVIYRHQDAGRSKVELAARFAKRLHAGVAIETFPFELDDKNADGLVGAYDWIVDGTDSLAVKQILNRACRRAAKPLVTASVHRFEGHLMTVLPDGPCLECLYPDWPDEDCVGTCEETGVLGVVPGMLGQMQAAEVLKGILGIGELLAHRVVLVDMRTFETTSIAREKREGCKGCLGSELEVLEVGSLTEAKNLLGDYDLIDIRELDELPVVSLQHRRIPLSSFDRSALLKPTVFYCSSGQRSRALTARLRASGVKDVFSLRGGIRRLAGH